MTQEEIAKVASGLSGPMISAMVTGDAYGTRVTSKAATGYALRSRGLIDDASRWTALGWAVVLHVVSTEPGWNPDHFKTPSEIHAEALQEDAERFPAPVRNEWQQIPDQRKGNVRCIETGIEIVAIGNGFRWEVLRPEWRRGERKIMHTERIFTTKIEALAHATRATRPVMRERIAYDHAEALLMEAARNAPTPAERIAAAPPATDAEIAHASRYAFGLRARILKRLQVAEDDVTVLRADLTAAWAEIDRLRGDA